MQMTRFPLLNYVGNKKSLFFVNFNFYVNYIRITINVDKML